MGWLFCNDITRRRDMVEERTKIQDTRTWASRDTKPVYHITTTLKHCYRGASFKGILWTVRETVKYDRKTDEVLTTERWIGCDILQWDNKDKCWGYKDLEESSGPSYYSCPLSYLDMVPESDTGYGKGWRVQVRAYHASRKPTFKVKKDMYVLLKEGYTYRVFKITSIKPLMGRNGSRTYTIPRKSLLREITREELDKAKVLYKEYLKKNWPAELDDKVYDERIGDDGIFSENEFLFQSSKKSVLQ